MQRDFDSVAYMQGQVPKMKSTHLRSLMQDQARFFVSDSTAVQVKSAQKGPQRLHVCPERANGGWLRGSKIFSSLSYAHRVYAVMPVDLMCSVSDMGGIQHGTVPNLEIAVQRHMHGYGVRALPLYVIHAWAWAVHKIMCPELGQQCEVLDYCRQKVDSETMSLSRCRGRSASIAYTKVCQVQTLRSR